MYRLLLAITAIVGITLVLAFPDVFEFFVEEVELDNIFVISTYLITTILCFGGFVWAYQKEYGISLFSKEKEVLKQKSEKHGLNDTIKLQSTRLIKNYYPILSFLLACLILIMNIASEEEDKVVDLYVISGILFLTSFILTLFRRRIEVGTDFSVYAQSYLFANVTFYQSWYHLPKIKKLGIAKVSAINTINSNEVNSHQIKITTYQLFAKFWETDEILVLLKDDDLESVKKQRRELSEYLNN